MKVLVHDGTRCSYKDAYSICVRGECVVRVYSNYIKLRFYELCVLLKLCTNSFNYTELMEVNQHRVHCDWIHSVYSLLWRKKVASLWCLYPVLLICSEMLFKEESVFLFEGIFQWSLGLFHSVFSSVVRAAWQIISKQLPLFITEYPEYDEISCVTFWCFRSSMDIKLFWLTVKTWHLLAKNKNLTRNRKKFPRCV